MEEPKDVGESIDYSTFSFADVTSPSQLDEVTLDPDSTFSGTMGLRQLNGPMRGRTVKEFEEQMSNLKKENFNLKLRIYFLEEKIGTHFTLDDDNILKKNIDLQTEVASLRKELEDKHELLCQAVKAIEVEEEEHKKYSQSKEEQLAQLQQELEELRIQIHSHVRSINGQSQVLEEQIVHLQEENRSKDETINQINRELESANERLVEYAQQIKEYEEKLSRSHQVKQSLALQLQDNKNQMEELKQKYVNTKYQLENELEKMKKEGDKTKMMKDMRISMLENDNEKHKMRIRDLQQKLDAALAEAKKNQNLAVSSSGDKLSRNSNTDTDFLPATNSTTPGGAQEKGSLHLSIGNRSESKSSKATVPPTPDGRSVTSFEQTILNRSSGDNDKLVKEFQHVKEEMEAYKKKIVKLKSDQLKACEIIKNMIEMKDKANQDFEKLKKEKEHLEKETRKLTSELEMVVSKPSENLRSRIAELSKAEDKVETPPCERAASLNDTGEQDMDIVEQYKALTVELESKIKILVATLEEKDHQFQDIRVKYDEILSVLEERENRIAELEFELLSNEKSSEKGDYSVSEKHSSFYKKELEDKDKEIEKLAFELKKCTCHLQSIVNKELWDKNRQIEKMQTKEHEHTPELLKLQKSLSTKEMQLQALKEKISELGFDLALSNDNSFNSPQKNSEHDQIKALQERLKAAKEERRYFEDKISELEKTNTIVTKLQIEQKDLLNQLETSEKLRFETNEICSALGIRLEELAIFLDSLLQQKSVLGFLGVAKNKRLREIISNSLDMSRSLTMSFIDNSEQSLAQLSNITALLNGSVFQDLSLACEMQEDEGGEVTSLSIVPSNATLTYTSHLNFKQVNTQPNPDSNNEQVIAALREQVLNLKSELRVRDNELNRLQEEKLESGVEKLTNTEEEERKQHSSTPQNKLSTPRSTTLPLTPKSNTSTITFRKERSDIQSESEAWSEPDRAVSRARIGLNDTLAPPTPRSSRLAYHESTEDDETGLGISPAKKRLSLMEMHQEVMRLENELDQKIEENCAEKQMYLEKLHDLEQDIKSMKEKLKIAQNEKEQAENQILELHKTVEELSMIKAKYEAESEGQNKELLNKLNEMEVEKNELLKKCLDFEKQAINAQNEVSSAQEKLEDMEEHMQCIELELKKDFEQTLVSKLQNAEEVFTNKITQVEKMYETELNKAKESVKHMQEECKRDYVKKTEVEKKLIQFENLTTDLNNLKTTVESYEETINSYKRKEQEMNDIIQDYREKTEALRRDLDHTTLQYSEAVLEKTKLCNDKAFLEQELNRVNSKQIELESKLSETMINQNEELSSLQSQKSSLELKISELESQNAELRNKLVKLQVEKCSLNRSLPIIRSTSLVTYNRQCSDRANYSSEENAEEMPRCFGDALINTTSNSNLNITTRADAERTVANSSPDLGIESDHGRFSSLETQPTNHNSSGNIARPLLETIHLTECMNNLFDEQNNSLEGVSSGDHCCRKSIEIIQENNELKRKLLRMKRALEDTTTQLTLANQRKKQVEKTICKQIHKTSQVLRKAKANLDSGPEM